MNASYLAWPLARRLGRRHPSRFVAVSGIIAGACWACAGCLSAPTAAGGGAPVAVRGCSPDGGAPPATAPGGYYTSGGTVCTAAGAPHVFHGVDRPSLEWDSTGVYLSEDDFKLMAGWGANVVRIALNQDFWLAGAALGDSTYPATVQRSVSWAESAGLDVILDLHWSDQGDLGVTSTLRQGTGYSNQQPMADANSIEFWREVATTFRGDGRVIFELYNEPHSITWDVWLHGGSAGGFTAAGMQQLYDAVRGTGANNLVIVGGNAWAYDLSSVGPGTFFVDGYNVMYATHPYLTSGSQPGAWEATFGRLETTDFAPVIATEFGDGSKPDCTGDWDRRLIQFADSHHMSWTAWAWYPASSDADPQGCGFPSLILDWATATPTVQGAAVKAALAAYPPPVPGAGSAGEAGAAGGDGGSSEADPSGEVDDGGSSEPDPSGDLDASLE